MPFSEMSQDDRDETVRTILSTTLNLAKELQRELGRLQQIVDDSLPRPRPIIRPPEDGP